MNVSLRCHRLCICYSKYNLVSRVSSKCNHTALLKDCVSLCIIYIYIYFVLTNDLYLWPLYFIMLLY